MKATDTEHAERVEPVPQPAMFSAASIALRQRPPARIARMVTVAICIMAVAMLAYASLASMDIVVTAPGRISASGKSKVIQSLEAGVVNAIAVRDGQAVKAGDVLLELDATATLADRDRLQRELHETQADVLRLDALLSGKAWAPDAGLPAAIVANQQAVLAYRRSEQNARLAGLDADIARRTADRDAIAAHLAQLRTSLPLVRQKHGMREELASTGYIARTAVIESRLELLNMEKELTVQGNRLSESAASLNAAIEQRKQAQAGASRVSCPGQHRAGGGDPQTGCGPARAGQGHPAPRIANAAQPD